MDQPPTSNLNGVMIIPTGISAALGGDAGFNSGIKLIASCCKKLIINPNATNASDIAEFPSNCLYTEGSTINRMLAGFINLKECKTYNKILCVANSPIFPANINAKNAGIWCLGANIELLALTTPLVMKAFINDDGTASGEFFGADELIEQVKSLDFDTLVIHTPITCSYETAITYWKTGGVNPWGAVESALSKYLSFRLNKQAIHGPVEFLEEPIFNTIVVKQSQAAEAISNTFLFCCLKGAHRAPIIDLTCDPKNLSNKDIDFMISPMCWSTPHESCLRNNIPVILVKENTTCLKDIVYPDNKNIIYVENYLEAAGIIMSWNAGVDPRTITLNK